MSDSTQADQQVSAMAVYKRLLSYALPHWKIFLLTAIATAVYGATDAGFAMFMKPLLDEGFINRDPGTVQWLPLMILGIFLVRGTTGFISTYGMSWVGRQVIKSLRKRMFDHLVSLPTGYYEKQTSGQLLARFTYHVEQVAHSTTTAVNVLVRDTITIITLLGYMIYLSGYLSLVFLVIGGIIAVLVRYVSRRLRNLSHRIQDSVGTISEVVSEVIEGHQVVKVFGGQEDERNRFNVINEKNRSTVMKAMFVNALNVPVVQFLGAIALAVIIYLVTGQDIFGEITPGGFVSFISAMMLLFPPMKRLTTLNATLQQGIAAGQSIFHLLDEMPEKDEGSVKLQRARGDIRFDQVCFHYPGRKEGVLHDIHLDIKAGEMIALVGRSGSGKSTIVKLLPRFYDVGAGSIYLDDNDVRALTLESLRQQIAFVSQQIVLFNDTVANNIAYGALHDVSREDIIRAAELANAREFIEKLPDGFDTLVGENGMSLSGGQRQRIAIARALLKDAPILILDEATSALDTESEKQIQRALENAVQGRTVIVIAHRLSTIESADRIVVMDNGRIVEQGTHAELMQTGKLYSQLHAIQFSS